MNLRRRGCVFTVLPAPCLVGAVLLALGGFLVAR